jgi:lysophospholipase L1-like esterase
MLLALARVLLCQLTLAATGTNPAITPVPRVAPWWVARHVEKLVAVKQGGVDLLFVGDSITQNYEKAGPAPDEVFLPIWESYFAAHHAFNLGYSGDQTQNVLWRLDNGEVDGLKPANVVLLIGTNNTAREDQTAEQVTAGVIAVVDGLRRRVAGAKILLVEILPSAVSMEKSAKDAAVNSAVRAHFAGSSVVRCLDLSSLFVKDGTLDVSLFYDPRLKTPHPALHPNTQGQRLMAQAVAVALFGDEERSVER